MKYISSINYKMNNFYAFFPIENKISFLKTSNDLCTQIWRELKQIQYLKSRHLSNKKRLLPWIEQAMIYYNDARFANWRSSGLLYYYSFLNLAKALIVGKGLLSYKIVGTKQVYHGLTAKQQDITNLTDFKISIHPREDKYSQKNVFAFLYEALMGIKWSYTSNISLNLSEVLPYCSDISSELESLVGITHAMNYVPSIIRRNENNIWFEILIGTIRSHHFGLQELHFLNNQVRFNQYTIEDKNTWKYYANENNLMLNNSVLLRSNLKSCNENNIFKIENDLRNEVLNIFKNKSIYNPSKSVEYPHWIYCPPIKIGNKQLPWHPLLSNYLVSFALSTMLRYQPQIFSKEDNKAFISEGWCVQSPITVLKYFLFELTDPSLVLQPY